MKMALKKIALSLTALAIVASPLASVQRVFAAAGPNLLSNASVETTDSNNLPTDWFKGGWGTNTANLSVSTDAHTGGKSIKVDITSYTDGDTKWYAKPVSLVGGKQYTYSDYYKSTLGTAVIVQFKSKTGTYSYADIAYPTASTTWKQVSGAFTAPTDIAEATVFHIIAGTGSLTVDDAYLGLTDDGTTTPTDPTTPTTPTPPVTGANAVANPSVETANGATPASWGTSDWGSHQATFTYENTGHTGSRSVSTNVTNYSGGVSMWAPAAASVAGGKLYQISDYYKSTLDTEVDMMVTMKDGSVAYYLLGTAAASTDWKQFTAQFTMPANAASVVMQHMVIGNGKLTIDDAAIGEYTPTGFNRAIVSLTFDDGWKSIYTNALPLMKKYGLTSTQYIITGVVGTDTEYMTKAQIKAFQSAGHEITSHTVTHPHLPQLTASKLTAELKNSQASLKSWFGVTSTDFASPYGEYNANVLTQIKKYYTSHRGVESGYNSRDNFDVYDIKVQNIEATTTPAEVVAWVAQAQKDKTWLVLVYHNVDNSGDAYGVTPANLDTELSNIKNSGVSVQTMTQAIKEVTPQLTK